MVILNVSGGLFGEYPWLTELPWGVQLKLRRAEEHMRALKAAIDKFIDTKPYELSRNLEFDGLEHVYWLSKVTNPPDRIAILVGDCVHCIRSSLDHLAYAMAEEGVARLGRCMTDPEFRTISFPIYNDPKWYASKVKKPGMRLIDKGFFTVVEPLQPYFDPRRPPWMHALWNVSELDNSDKHRIIATTGCDTPNLAIHNLDLPPHVTVLNGGPHPREWKRGAEVIRFRFEEPHPEVDMQIVPTFSVALQNAPHPPTFGADIAFDVWLQWICESVFFPLRQP